MSQPGTVFTAESAAKYLKEQNKNYLGQQTWLQAYDDIGKGYGLVATDLDLAAQRSENLLTEDYANNIAEAYKNAKSQNQMILNSNLGQGFKEQGIADTEAALNEAYKSYLRNYQSEKSAIQNDLSKSFRSLSDAENSAIELVNNELELQAKNTADYLNAHFDYLTKLYEKNEELFDTDEYSDYIKSEMSEGIMTRTGLKELSDLRTMMFDENGNINDRGIDFIKQIQSTDAIEGIYGFGDYLYDTNKDLYKWSIGLNPYDTTYYDMFGNATNRASALGSLKTKDGLGLINDNNVIDTSWKYTSKDKTVTPYEVITNSKDFGDIKYYESGNYGSIASLDSLTLKGKSKIRDVGGDNFRVEFTGDSTNRTYRLELVSDNEDDAVVDDETLQEIDKSVGGIENNRLYFIGDKLYVGFVFDDGSKKLRKVQGQGGQGNYKRMIATLQNPTELAKQASK